MIYYFTGTGNSEYVAKTIANFLSQKLNFIPLTDASKELNEGEDVGFIFPVYSWGVPPLVLEFISRLSTSFWDEMKRGQGRAWCVMTCGDETALAPEMFSKCLKNYSGENPKGIWSIIMPNNYVLLPGFDVDSKSLEKDKLERVPGRILEIVEGIKNNLQVVDVTRGKLAWLKTKAVYPLFKKWGVNAGKWHYLPTCIGCGKCAETCPLKNITMKERHPEWGRNCCSCLGCYHICPVHAVVYGKETLKKGQYFFPLLKRKGGN